MKVFLSFPPEAREVATRVESALRAAGHEVLRDLGNLFEATARKEALARRVASADRFVCIVTRSLAVDDDTRHELMLAEGKWPDPAGRVIAVYLAGSDPATVPAYLRGAAPIDAARSDPQMVAEAVLRAIDEPSRPAIPPPGRRPRLRTVLLAAAALAAAPAGWALMSMIDRDPPAPPAPQPLPEDVRHRAVALELTYDGFAVAVASPNQVILFDSSGARQPEVLSFRGRITALARTPHRLLVVTRSTFGPGLYTFDSRNWAPKDTILVGDTIPHDVFWDIGSLATPSGAEWGAPAEPDGRTAVAYLNASREWRSSPYSPPAGSTVRLREAGGLLWAVAWDGLTSSLVQVNVSSIHTFSSDSLEELRCARDVIENARRNLLVLSCDNELVEMAFQDNRLRVVGKRATLRPDPGGDLDADLHRIARDGFSVFVALNTFASDARRTPRRARVAQVDDGVAEPRLLFDQPDAVITSMVVTSRVVVVLLRRADGTTDAAYVPRG